MPDDASAIGTLSHAYGKSTPLVPQHQPIFRPCPRWFDAFARVVHRLSWRARLFEYSLPLIEREYRSTVKVPWHRRPGLWRRGFLGESRVLYDFTRFRLDDKLQFARLLAKFPDHAPQLFGVLHDGRVIDPYVHDAPGSTLGELVQQHGALVVKPSSGGGGDGVAVLQANDAGDILHNGARSTCSDLADYAAAADGMLVTEFVRQHSIIAALHPGTTNTVRLVTMRDETCEPFIAAAVLRIGCSRSNPTDNWIKGALSAPIDLERGTLGMAASYPAGRRRLEWHAAHPESGTSIAGTRLPHWRMVVAGILAIARSLPFLRYVGWDIVVTANGFSVLEGNSYSGVNLFQIHGPLLADPKVAAFFRRHGVLAR
jgi:hypothetical protein